MEDLPSIRVLVCGEAGTGKTTLCQSLCQTYDTLPFYSPTIGCKIHIRMNAASTGSYFTELIDIGGSPRFASSRQLFYDNIDAVIYV
jgi:GTPase SAR1 family protein